jgi:hypothetical protein
MPGRWTSGRPYVLPVLFAGLAAWACGGHPTAPETPLASTAARGQLMGGGASAAATDDNQPPYAVFRTRPRADEEGVIAGGSSFEVTFNLCQTRDYDEGDELRFSFDFDGDGNVDELGHCRAKRRYEVATFESACFTAVACVTDRQPEHKICQTYQVCLNGRAREPAPSTSPEPEVFEEQHVEGDFRAFGATDAWAFTAQPGTSVSLALDTVSAPTAYWMLGCISTTSTWAGCIVPVSKSWAACTYPPPLGVPCPSRTTVLPANPGGVYYLMVGGIRPTRTPGQYTALVQASPGIGRLTLFRDNGEAPDSIEQP